MKKTRCILAALAVCLLLSACGLFATTPPDEPLVDPDPSVTTPDVPNQPDEPDQPDEPAAPVELGDLAVEVVVDWEDTDRVLSSLSDCSLLLGDALREYGYEADEITVTISTAGGITGGSLAEGGVDIACLPAVDYVACEPDTAAVLTTDEALCTGVVAVTAHREELDEAFRAALAGALLESEAGALFLETCYPETAYIPAKEEAIQAVRDWVAEQEEAAHGA